MEVKFEDGSVGTIDIRTVHVKYDSDLNVPQEVGNYYENFGRDLGEDEVVEGVATDSSNQGASDQLVAGGLGGSAVFQGVIVQNPIIQQHEDLVIVIENGVEPGVLGLDQKPSEVLQSELVSGDSADPLPSSQQWVFCVDPLSAEQSPPVTNIGESELETLDNAVNEWYTKMSGSNAISDEDILDALDQVAPKLNIKVSPFFKLEWLKRFKTIRGINDTESGSPKLVTDSKTERRPVSDGGPPPKKSKGNKIQQPVEVEETFGDLELPTRILLYENGFSESIFSSQYVSFGEEKCDFSRVTSPVSYTCEEFDETVQELINHYCLEKTTGESRLLDLLTELSSWMILQGSVPQISFYELRLKVAVVAHALGLQGFMLNDHWLRKFRNQRPDKFFDIIIPKVPKLTPGGSFRDVALPLYAYYLSESSKRLVSCFDLERKAIEIAHENKFAGFRIDKNWLRRFVLTFGLFCVVNGRRVLFEKPEIGRYSMISIQFDAAYECWYYDWPVMFHEMEVSSEPSHRRMRALQAAVFDWYIETSSSGKVSSEQINKKEQEIASNFGVKRSDLDIGEWHNSWCNECCQALSKLTEFNKELTRYPIRDMTRVRLEQIAIEVAGKTGADSSPLLFHPTKSWMFRFAVLNGLFVGKRNPVFISSHELRSSNYESVLTLFDEWYSAEEICQTVSKGGKTEMILVSQPELNLASEAANESSLVVLSEEVQAELMDELNKEGGVSEQDVTSSLMIEDVKCDI